MSLMILKDYDSRYAVIAADIHPNVFVANAAEKFEPGSIKLLYVPRNPYSAEWTQALALDWVLRVFIPAFKVTRDPSGAVLGRGVHFPVTDEEQMLRILLEIARADQVIYQRLREVEQSRFNLKMMAIRNLRG